MRVPEVLYGSRLEVMRRAPAFVREVMSRRSSRGRSSVDTQLEDGLLVVDSSCRMTRSGRHFHLFAPMAALMCEVSAAGPNPARLFDFLLDFEWGPLAVLEQTVRGVSLRESRLTALLRAFLRHWPAYWAEGERYAAWPNAPTNLWEAAFVLKYGLLLRGIPKADLLSPPCDGLRGLFERHADKLSDVLTGDTPSLRASGT